MQADPQRAQDATAAYPMQAPKLSPITVGHINETYLVQDGETKFVLQRLNPIFDAHVHLDIDAITKHLAQKGITTPTLVHTRDGKLWTVDSQGGVWRMLTFIAGQVFTAMKSAALCTEAGRLLGTFHCALSDMQHRFAAKRLGVHDTPRHLKGLRDAVETLTTHVAHAEVTAIAARIFALTDKLPDLHATPSRIVHGDPKLSNIIFDEQNLARAFVDLDTLADMPLCLELGDALRSWCNPGGETHGKFSLPFFEAALRGYAKGADGFLRGDEIALLPAALPTISLELAARFARDALEESYFGWDRENFSAAWQHNLVRAKSQVELAYSYAKHAQDAEALIKRVF